MLDDRGSYNGVSWGAGTSYRLQEIDGLDDAPVVRGQDDPRSNEQGSFGGPHYLGERIVTVKLYMSQATKAAYEALITPLGTATIPDDQYRALYYDNSTRLVWARVDKRRLPRALKQWMRAGNATVEFVARDPRKYDATETVASVGLPSGGSSGIGPFPIGPFPIGFGTSTGGSMLVTNAGNFETRPVITLAGPCDNPKAENTTAGRFLKFSLSLGVGDTLTIDLDAKSVLLNGTASRRSAMTADSQWWNLAPGTSTLRFASDAYQAAALMTVRFRSAWI